MSRYIDATALKKYISCIPALEGWRNMIRLICKWVDKQPTADVAPVVHGRWIVYEDEYGICATEITCSVCKQTYCSSEYTDSEFIDNTRFCPNCGAKMDGGEDECKI